MRKSTKTNNRTSLSKKKVSFLERWTQTTLELQTDMMLSMIDSKMTPWIKWFFYGLFGGFAILFWYIDWTIWMYICLAFIAIQLYIEIINIIKRIKRWFTKD